MSMKFSKNKILSIFLLVVFLVFLALAYFTYPIVKERYFKEKDTLPITNDNPDNSTKQKGDISNNQKNEEIDKVKAPTEDEFVSKEEITSFGEINKEDCANGCTSFETEKEKDYCLKVCNSDQEIKDIGECATKEGLEKDFCHKILGIENKDFDECKKIKDTNIRETCINIVAEKILERKELIEKNP